MVLILVYILAYNRVEVSPELLDTIFVQDFDENNDRQQPGTITHKI